MRVLVLGAGGMLGSALMDALEAKQAQIESTGLTHKECDILDPDALKEARKSTRPELVINCAGAPNKNELVNSLGPWYISRTFSCKVWHISTDCVFDPDSKQVHKPTDVPRPATEYGISKLLGEQTAPHVSNIRTSFIGQRHGLLRWLLDQPPGSTVNGWDRAYWSGSTVEAVAEALVEFILEKRILPTVVHLCMATAHAVSKYDVLAKLIRTYSLDLSLKRDSSVYINRMMEPTLYLPNLDEALGKDPTINLHLPLPVGSNA